MKIEELQEKISALDKSSKLIDQKFVLFVRNSDKCTNMLETISEAHALKRKYEGQVDDMGKLEETLKLLKDKKGTFSVLICGFGNLFFRTIK